MTNTHHEIYRKLEAVIEEIEGEMMGGRGMMDCRIECHGCPFARFDDICVAMGVVGLFRAPEEHEDDEEDEE
jgi:hypothetical protein